MKRRNFLTTHQKTIYKRKRFKNPYFKKRKKRAWRTFFLFLSLFLITCSIPLALGFAPVFKIHEIQIQGLTSITQENVESIVQNQLQKKRYLIFPQNTRFFLKTSQLKNELQKVFDFDTLEIYIENQRIHIQVEERIQGLIWNSQGQYQFIDLEGMIIGSLDESEVTQINQRLNIVAPISDNELETTLQPTMPIIVDISQTDIAVDQQIFSHEIVQNIIDFDKFQSALSR